MRSRFFLPAVVLLAAAALACAGRAERCWVCQREIHSQVKAVLTLENGKKVPACCPRCALRYREEPGSRVKEIQLTDYAGHRPLPVDRAYLVEGSDETPCLHHHAPVMDDSRTPMGVCYDRCMPSLIAFATPEEARAFLKDHGGTLYAPGELPSLR
jgi:hypothetical protein